MFVRGRALLELNIWMNGPRNQWDRGLQTSLRLVILFKLGTIGGGWAVFEYNYKLNPLNGSQKVSYGRQIILRQTVQRHIVREKLIMLRQIVWTALI